EAYNEKKPFFTFNIQQNITTEENSYKYYINITLDIKGNIIVTAEDEERKEITDISKMKVTINEDSLEQFQQTILENFWKLNENLPRGEGNKLETMTVTLSEEEKEVVGVGPDNPRFIQ